MRIREQTGLKICNSQVFFFLKSVSVAWVGGVDIWFKAQGYSRDLMLPLQGRDLSIALIVEQLKSGVLRI